MNDGGTCVIELTPRGRAAVAVVLVAGPAASSAVDQCLVTPGGRSVTNAPSGQILLGRWGASDGEEVIVCRRSSERVEVHCHGGLSAVRSVIDRLAECGCRPTAWQDFVRADELDPIRAAARTALADATTSRTAAILLDQYEGALALALAAALQAAAAEQWDDTARRLDDLLAFREFGRHLKSPWRVVIAGPANVGKSTLLNALAGYQRAIVSPQPGTTRDVVTLTTAIDGWPVQLADTAGLREPGDPVEAAGIELAGAAIAEADLVIQVRDASAIDGPADRASDPMILDAARAPLDVINKIDLISIPELDELRSRFARDNCVPIFTSALTAVGVSLLIAAVVRALVPLAPAPGAAVPFTDEQLAALDRARAAAGHRDAHRTRQALQSLLSP